jgi:hypothetical protein
MTATSSPTVPVQPPEPAPPKSRKGIKIAAAVVIGLVLLGGGFAAGYASGQSPIHGYQQQIAQMHRNLTAEQAKLATEKATLATEQTQVQTAQTAAQNALTTATAQVKAQYKSKFAALQAKEQKVAGLQAKLNRELGVVAKSTISQDGVYVVGKDIPAGTYHTSGAGANASPGGACYFATLVSSTNTNDVNNISDNNNFNGPETVDLSGMYAFQISGGCTWVKI